MRGINAEFVPVVEFIRFLDAFEPAQQPSDSRKHGVLVIVRLEIFLKRAHGVDCIDIGRQRPKEGVVDDALPGLIGQCLGIVPVQGVYVQEAEDGKKHAYGYVMKKEFDKK